VTSTGKRGWSKTLSGVPSSAKGKRSTRSRTKTASKRKTARRSARKLFGNMSIKGIVIGGSLLAAAKTLVRRMAPQLGAYTPGASALGAGVAADVMGISGKSLKTFGAVDLASEAIVDLIMPGGLVTLPGVVAQKTGGYQY